MKVQNNIKTKKMNNDGFSLLEVLVAVIILAIISIPLIRSFGTVSVTNSKSRILMLATDCAENMMELIELQKIDELATRYGASAENTVAVNADGVYTFSIKKTADLPSNLPTGYYLDVKLDPTLYPNNNALNISDVKSMSLKDTAVYEMSPLYDAGIYTTFHNWNKSAVETNTTMYMTASTDYFERNLTRYIDITIAKQGSEIGADGDAVDLVTVNLDIRYEFKSANLYWRYLPSDQSEYVEETQEIFNNLSTKEPLAGIYLFYQPRFLATQNGNADVITIYNPDNIETNLFLATQPGGGNAVAESLYFNTTTGPIVTIEETWGSSDIEDAAITLFTNLSKEAPYSKIDGVDGDILCRLIYQDAAGMGAKKTGNDAGVVLDGRNLDGKVLVKNNTKNRIYKVTTTVRDGNGNKILELDGTKLE